MSNKIQLLKDKIHAHRVFYENKIGAYRTLSLFSTSLSVLCSALIVVTLSLGLTYETMTSKDIGIVLGVAALLLHGIEIVSKYKRLESQYDTISKDLKTLHMEVEFLASSEPHDKEELERIVENFKHVIKTQGSSLRGVTTTNMT